jgi:hypothetical protein
MTFLISGRQSHKNGIQGLRYMAQEEEYLSRKHESLSLNSSTAKKQNKAKQNKTKR